MIKCNILRSFEDQLKHFGFLLALAHQGPSSTLLSFRCYESIWIYTFSTQTQFSLVCSSACQTYPFRGQRKIQILGTWICNAASLLRNRYGSVDSAHISFSSSHPLTKQTTFKQAKRSHRHDYLHRNIHESTRYDCTCSNLSYFPQC